jgi:ADP-heptose:LPS heptosyltransferase
MITFLLKKLINKPDLVLKYGNSLGDDLLCTIIANQLFLNGKKNIWVKTNYPELYYNNPYISRIVTNKNERFFNYYISKLSIPEVQPLYSNYNNLSDSDKIPDKHIIYKMCDSSRVQYPLKLSPFIFLTNKEKKVGSKYSGCIIIQSSGISSNNPMTTKEWDYNKFNDLVSKLKNKFTFVQIGANSDPLLNNVIDLRGKTNIRESASILFNAKLFIGLVGFLMHLSKAVNCKSVIIYGGREQPSQSGYIENENICTSLECSPCWIRSNCPNNMKCMSQISVEDVLNSVYKSI